MPEDVQRTMLACIAAYNRNIRLEMSLADDLVKMAVALDGEPDYLDAQNAMLCLARLHRDGVVEASAQLAAMNREYVSLFGGASQASSVRFRSRSSTRSRADQSRRPDAARPR